MAFLRSLLGGKPDHMFWSGIGVGMILSAWKGYSLGHAAFSFFIMLTVALLLWRIFRE